MILEFIILIAGFALLLKGADIFVNASVDIAKRLKVPSIVIGLTIVALGTSAPEAVVSVSAAVKGSTGLAIGNAVGSNLFNLLIVIGVSAVIKPICADIKEMSKDFWVSVGSALVLLAAMLIFREQLPRYVSFLLFAGFTVYMVTLVRQSLKNRPGDAAEPENGSEEPKSLAGVILFTIAGIAAIIAGGQLTVTSAVNIAQWAGVTDRVIGLTVLALGTSLPELITSVIACIKKENDIAIGNIIGSNIFNLLFVLGLSGMVLPLAVDSNLIYDMAVLTAGSMAFYIFVRTGNRIARGEGLILLLMYAAYASSLLLFVS